jgi:transketolase
MAHQPDLPTDETIRCLKRKCVDVRRGIIDAVHFGGGGHVGGALSCVEFLTVLYFHTLRVRPDQPDWPERDRFILSKGHAAPSLYAVLAERGYFPVKELKCFSTSGTRLQKHIDMFKVPGADASSGSLGQGLSIAVGMALADRIDHKDRRVYCLIGDGESQEGQIWEAAMAAARYQLDRLTVFLDNNQMQVDGFTREIMPVEPLQAKWEAFGWRVQRIDGHDIRQIINAITIAQTSAGKPQMIIGDTVKGKGISYMENKVEWHSHPINDEEYAAAIAELNAAKAQIEAAGENHA